MPEGLDYAKSQTDTFHKVFGHPVSDSPRELTRDEVISRVRFINEELVELMGTVAINEHDFVTMTNNLQDDVLAARKKELEKGLGSGIVDQADALTDINYFVQGTFTMMGVQPQPLFDIVQEANMSKLGPDGKPIYRESDNKIMKPEGWQPPEPKLEREIERQKGRLFKYNVGQKVKVREDLNWHTIYRMEDDRSNSNCAVQEMIDLAGKTVTIKEHCVNGQYKAEETDALFNWVDEMFEGKA